MTYKEDMKFQKHLSLWDWQSSGVSARNEFRRSMARRHEISRYLSLWDCQGSGVSARNKFKHLMAPNSPWISPCVKGNLRYITPSSSIPLFPLVLISLFYVKLPLILPFGRQASLTRYCSLDYRNPKYIWLLRVALSLSIIKSPLETDIRDLAYSLLLALPHLHASMYYRPNSYIFCKETDRGWRGILLISD